jgi:hypothetical protein
VEELSPVVFVPLAQSSSVCHQLEHERVELIAELVVRTFGQTQHGHLRLLLALQDAEATLGEFAL